MIASSPGQSYWLALLAAGAALLLVSAAAAAYAGFACLGLANGAGATGAGAAWAHAFGVERLGEIQGVGQATRIGAAALGPLTLALALSLTGSYTPGLAVLSALSVGCAVAGIGLAREALTAESSSVVLTCPHFEDPVLDPIR